MTLLPVLHYVLLGFSRHVARFISSTGYEVRPPAPPLTVGRGTVLVYTARCGGL